MDSIKALFNQLPHWSIPLLGIVALFIINRIIHWVLRFFIKRQQPDSQPWRHALLDAGEVPLRALIWVYGLSILAYVSPLNHNIQVTNKGISAVGRILVILIIGWALFRLTSRLQRNFRLRGIRQKNPVDPTLVDVAGKLSMTVIVTVMVLSIMQAMRVPLSGLLAFGGAAGIAVGFAAQTLVANLFGGLTIFASRIFKIGESIIIPGTDLMGEVTHIGWRSTRVLGFDCKPFYIPNALFNTTSVINHTRMSFRRASEYIYLRYEDMDKIKNISKRGNDMLVAHEKVDYFVFRFNSYKPQALEFYLYAYIKTTAYDEYMRLKEDILLTLANIIREEGAELILPLSHIHLENNAAAPSLPTPETTH